MAPKQKNCRPSDHGINAADRGEPPRELPAHGWRKLTLGQAEFRFCDALRAGYKQISLWQEEPGIFRVKQPEGASQQAGKERRGQITMRLDSKPCVAQRPTQAQS